NLYRLRHVNYQDPVDQRVCAGLQKQGGYQDRVGRRGLLQGLGAMLTDQRMQKVFQPAFAVRIAENGATQGTAVQGSIRLNELGAEVRGNLLQRGSARFNDLPC